MKKLLLTFAAATIALTQVKAQGTLGKGNTQVNLGLGFSSWGLPVFAGFDYGVSKNITLGAEASFRSYNTVGYDFTVIGISGNANYHFNEVLELPSEWDLYAGINVGYFIYSNPSGYRGASMSGLGLGAQVGARYFFTKKFGINLEAGGGNAANGGKIGATIKL